MTYADTVKFLIAMIIMMNPLGSLSIFLEMTNKAKLPSQRQTALKCGIAMSIIMVASIWIGGQLLDLMGITISSFRFAGGIILLFTGLSMLHPKENLAVISAEDDVRVQSRNESIAIVPLALPIIIGPGAISTLVIASNDYPNFLLKVWLSVLCLLLAGGMYAMLYFGVSIARFLGESVMGVITRIMGMVLMAIAVGMLANGLVGLIPALR